MLKVFNTLTKKKELFTPIHGGNVSFYLCGPTVYDVGHLGHARAAVSFDMIRRYLAYRGFRVKFVSNYTDIDDKVINRAKQLGISVKELADRVISEYEKDYGDLGVLPPDISPKATEYILQMVAMVETLVQKEYAYATDDGIYFEVKKFRDYGKLSGQKLDGLIGGARVSVNENKRNQEDFALWKQGKPDEPFWDGPFGMRGRPGWHIECSVMTKETLGETFDIHAGGQDLIFPHHEDEIAQSEAANGKSFARYWLHNGHVKINQEKMSKSLGNFFTIKEVLAKYHPQVIRYFLLSTHYRMPIDYTPDLLEQAKSSLTRLQDFWRMLERISSGAEPKFPKRSKVKVLLEKIEQDFQKAMDDDFEISEALASLFELVREANVLIIEKSLLFEEASTILQHLKKIDYVLGVMEVEKKTLDNEIYQLIQERSQARREKNFKRADEIRKILSEKNIILEDIGTGTTWKKQL